MAQDVTAFQQSGAIGSEFQIIATARRGHTAAELQKVIDEELEKLRREPPDAREVQRAINQVEASFYRRMERVMQQGRLAERLLRCRRRARLLRRGSGALHVAEPV